MTTETPEKETNEHDEQSPEPRFGGRKDWADTHVSGLPLANNDIAQKKDGRDALASKENDPTSGTNSNIGSEEKRLYNPSDDTRSHQEQMINLAAKIITRKNGVIGGISAVIIGALIYMGSIGQGPFQLIHLSQILQKPLAGQEKTSKLRFHGLYRFAKNGEFGETRVGYWASRSVNKSIDQLKVSGTTFEGRSTLGRYQSISFDTSNSRNVYGDKSPIQARAAIIKDHNISNQNAVRIVGTKIIVDIDNTIRSDLNLSKTLSKTAFSNLENGKIVTGLKIRNFKKFFGLPNLFSPISERTAASGEQFASSRDRALQNETERAQPRIDATESRTAEIRNRLKGKIDGKEAKITGSLVATEALCFARNVADDAVAYNHAAIVAPSIMEATDKNAVGSQVQSGKKLKLSAVGDIVQSFTDDKGRSIWGAKSLQALSKNGRVTGGEDMPTEFQQAFSNKTTADNIKSSVRQDVLGVDFGGAACSPVGQGAQILTSLGLLIAGPFTGGGSWAIFAAKEGAKAAATAGIMYLLKTQLTKIIASGSIVPIPPSGPLGGNILAYGSRAGANMSAISSGGVALSRTETITLLRQQELEENNEFRSKSFFARIFDRNDYRSLISRTTDSSNLNPTQSLSNVASAATSLPTTFAGSVSSLFTPLAYAAVEDYDWSFPLYGIPQEILTDANYEDPYDNADKVAAILTSTNTYVGKASRCFGVNISKDDKGWNAVADKEVNPSDKEYADANCSDLSDPNWKRVMLFIFDTRLTAAMACYDGEDEACEDLGAGGTASANESSSSNTAQIVDGSARELAQKLLDYKKEGKYDCFNPGDCGDLELMAAGKSISCATNPSPPCHPDQACHVEALDKRVLQLIIYLIDKGYKIKTYALCRSHSQTGGVHDDGKGLDISHINNKTLGPGAPPEVKALALEVDKILLELDGDLAPRQIITSGVGATRQLDPAFIKYNREAPGSEGAAAITGFGGATGSTITGHTDHIHVGY